MKRIPTPQRIPTPITTLRDLPHTSAWKNCFALTFDDGPVEPWTADLLDVLKSFDAPATFFVLGSRAAENPALIARMLDQGCTVAIHGWDHPHLPDLSPEERGAQIGRTRELLERQTGKDCRYVRPPYGDVTDEVMAELADAGLTPVFWSVHAWDWERPGADRIASDVDEGLEDGAVVLLHDGGGDRSQTVEAVRTILGEAARRGLRPVALPYV